MQYLTLCVLMAMGSAAGAYADGCCPPKPCCEPVVCPCLPDDCCERNVCPPIGVITPQVDLIKCPGMYWFLTGDYIYWTAREENLEFAALLQSQETTEGSGGFSSNEVFRLNNSKYESGFKVGMGTNFCHDGWDFYAEYTWLETNNKKSTPVFPNEGLHTQGFDPRMVDNYWVINGTGGIVTTTHGFASAIAQSASAKWRLNFNVVDLELGRNFYVSPRLMLRPFKKVYANLCIDTSGEQRF